MSLFGLSPFAFLLGAVGLAAGVTLLHLLRVRLRRVEVDTLLFFRLAGALQKPRVLPGKPARFLSWALSLAIALCALAAIAEPRSALAAPSRIVVVEPDAATADERIAQAQQLAARGLGPRGAVLAATTPPVVLLAADEPIAALATRAAALRTTASPFANEQTLQVARARMATNDTVQWLGAAAPATASADVQVVPPARRSAMPLRGLQWERGEDGAGVLQLRLDGGPFDAELRAGDRSLARARLDAPLGELRLGPIAATTGTVQLVLTGPAGTRTLDVPCADAPPLRVFVDASLPAELARAVATVLAADGELQPAADAASAEVIVAARDDGNDARPRLVVTPGEGQGARLAVRTADAPVACSLRDQRRRDAGALPPFANANVWITDAAQGGALAVAMQTDGHLRVQIVDWLLQPVSHADVPLLLATALRELGARPRQLLALCGQPLALPAAFAAPAVADGERTLTFATAGAQTLATPAGARSVSVLDAALPPQSLPAAAPAATPSLASGAWLPWLLALLVLALAVDAVLFHRGRLP